MPDDLGRYPAARSWTPGQLREWERLPGGAVLLRRELIGSSSKGTWSVFERACGSAAEASAYAEEFGAPERCPAPWGDVPKPPPDWWERQRLGSGTR